ncbi:bifunctional cytidylyltransferase/SDR family oxidoreductase [Nonomuraea sp. K274]|uniref:2-C-methyl-D-erythritol 4-phosphate cytidylyltransferase n=1 Tax=Nonomuraea cypriaca TaxID=1187855 RepID=A0A931A7L6_9ACTN|nr:bifunctional cytidylyltransferase/SDR family oxidoreductase [Nonomuraea cypriaca]MBF8186658.1 bifunctional cytidylyltransferase/SDR family oxidoreductase [Nonomuraea cypriaca]
MDSRLRAVGVLLAGGVGRRVGLDTPKQLIEVAGRTIIEHSLAVFQGAPEIDEIVVLITPGYSGEVRDIVTRGGYDKVSQIVDGGASRTESTWRALRALGTEECDVLLHDAVRPLLEPRIITECVRALERHSAVNVAIPSSDTVLVAAPAPDGEIIGEVLDRSRLRRSQTPQCFRLSVIREAYERALADPGFAGLPATDDCGVVLRYLPEVPIHLVPGSEHNIKVTHPADLHIAERLFELAAEVPQCDRKALDGRSVVVLGDHGAETAAQAAAYGARVRTFTRADGVRVDDHDSVAKALEGVGRVDHVVNAAGASHIGRLAEATGETVTEVVGTGHLGALNVARAARPHLRGSLLLQLPHGAGALHASARAAVVALTRALAREWAADGIRVNCIDTGASPLAVAQTSLDILISDLSGQVIDVGVDRT